mgnify:CR=1 FL=1
MTCLNREEYGATDVLSPVGPEGNEWAASNFCFFRYFNVQNERLMTKLLMSFSLKSVLIKRK